MDNTTFSLLYTSKELMEKSSSLQESVTRFRYNPEMITDLQLDELCSFLFDDENFCQPEEFLKILCTNVRDILYRQQIINDLTQNPNLLKSFHAISKELKSLTELKTLYENRKEAWIKYDLLYRLLIRYVECVSLLIESLKLADINSEGLIACRNWIEMKYDKENITQLKLNLAQVKKDYKQVKGLIAGVNVNEYCEPKCLTIEKIIYEEFALSGIPLAETPRNHIIQDDLPASDTRQYLGLSSINSMTKFGNNANGQLLSLYLNKKLQKILKDQTNMIKNSLSQYENIDFSNLIDQYNALIFYYTAVRWYNLLSSKSLKSTQPKACDREFKFCAEGCYSPIFVLRMNPEDISSNDVNLHKDVYVITGANSAGKTSMLRTVALNQILFFAGFHVCAKKAELSVSNEIYSSFSTGEIIDDSRFGMEVARVQSIIETSKCNSFILLNEPFTSTNPAEGVNICIKVIERLIQKGVRVIVVTHYYELYELLKNSGLSAESLLMREIYESEKDRLLSKRRHKLFVEEPDGINFAKEIAEQFGFNVENILSRFSADIESYSHLREMKL